MLQIVDTTIAEQVANAIHGTRYGVDWIYHDDRLGYLPAKPIETLEPVAADHAKYRLLTDDDMVAVGDQFLADDCVSWWTLTDAANEPRWMIGKRYSRNFFVPGRRRLAVTPSQGEEGK